MADTTATQTRPTTGTAAPKSDAQNTSASKLRDLFGPLLKDTFGDSAGLSLKGIVTSVAVRDFTSKKEGKPERFFKIMEATITDGEKGYKVSHWSTPAEGEVLPNIEMFDAVQVTEMSQCKIEYGDVSASGKISLVA